MEARQIFCYSPLKIDSFALLAVLTKSSRSYVRFKFSSMWDTYNFVMIPAKQKESNTCLYTLLLRLCINLFVALRGLTAENHACKYMWLDSINICKRVNRSYFVSFLLFKCECEVITVLIKCSYVCFRMFVYKNSV